MSAGELGVFLASWRASEGLREWAHGKSLAEFWILCPRADWMILVATKMADLSDYPSRRDVARATRCLLRPAEPMAQGEWPSGLESEPEALDAWAKGEEDSYSPERTAEYAVTVAVKAVSNGWDELRTITGITIFLGITWLVSGLFTGSYEGYGIAVAIVTASILLRKFALNSERRVSAAMHR